MTSDHYFVPFVHVGHGGADSGAVHNELVEKDINLETAKRLDASFCGTGIVPVLDRQGDYNPSWEARYKAAKEAGANIVLGVHFNANADHNVGGAEAYHWPGNEFTRAVGREFLNAMPPELRRGKIFAATDEPGADDDWLQRPRLIVEAFRELPVVVCECGYLSNESDAALIKRPWVLDGIVSALRCAIVRAAYLKEPKT